MHPLFDAAKAGRLPHALLFSGPEGVGKRASAILLARAILAEGGNASPEDVARFDRFAHEGFVVYADADSPNPVRRARVLGEEMSEKDLLEAYGILESEGWIRGFAATSGLRGASVIDLFERDTERFLGRRNIPFADVLEKELAALERSKKGGPTAVRVARNLFAPGISQVVYKRSLGIELVNGRGDGSYFRTVDSLLRTARGGARAVVVIDDAHKMTEEAENAFLKTLEEPPPGSHLILVTHEPLSMLSTTLSRCARVVFGAIGREPLERWLVETGNAAAAEAALLATLAEGSAGGALRLRGLALEERRRALEELLPLIAAGDLSRVLAHTGRRFAGAAESGESGPESARVEARLLLDLLAVSLRDLVLASSYEGFRSASGLDPAWIAALARRRDPEDWERLFRRAELAADDVASSVEPRLAVEALFADALPAAEAHA